jgi:hypothetical protein
MAIRFTCECGKEFRAKDEYAGRRAICPACQRQFVIQHPAVRQEEVAAIPAESPPFPAVELSGHANTQDEHADVDRPIMERPGSPPMVDVTALC